MSIHYVVTYKDPNKEELFGPVAGYGTFWECWFPASRELELRRIPLFDTGYPVIELNQETIPEVMEELQLLRSHFAEHGDQYPSSCAPVNIVRRIDTLLNVLGDALENWDEIEYIRV